MSERFDVVVVGGGNAAFCAAQAAAEAGGSVVMLEKSPLEQAGGNSFFTAGATRVAYRDLDTVRPLLEGLNDELAARIDLPAYTEEHFLADMLRLTEGRCDRELADILIGDSLETVRWMHAKGIRWELMFPRQSFPVGDRIQFFGGLALGVVGGGRGLIEQHTDSARRAGISIR